MSPETITYVRELIKRDLSFHKEQIGILAKHEFSESLENALELYAKAWIALKDFETL